MTLTHRYIARIVLEAQTGLFVGSGEAGLLKDALVQRDHNGWPMIQGTSLTGVLFHVLEEGKDGSGADWKNIFGFQAENSKEGLGSRLRVSSAYMLVNNCEIAEGLNPEVDQNTKHKYRNLPSRQHVKITDKGVAQKNGLFDNEIVYKGTRFILEIELKGSQADKSNWDQIIAQFRSPLFRIGQGTRNGYGKLKVHSLSEREYDLKTKKDFEDYLDFDPSLNASNKGFETSYSSDTEFGLTEYTLDLTPDSFFIFSEGFGDSQADNKPVTEEIAVYDGQSSTIAFERRTLIPATSIKGAIAHRTRFHYNRLEGAFADNSKGTTVTDSVAVKELFGSLAGNNDSRRGSVILDDLYFEDIDNDKIFNHVAIDRFTGGALDGALFSEKVSRKADNRLSFSLYLTKSFSGNVLTAFENALIDICKGLLPLGGMTTKGHGLFTGKVSRNNETIFDYAKAAN